jgi:hypothetical protein
MKNNRRKEANKWQGEMDRVETARKVLLLTAFLQEIQEFPETIVPEVKAQELLMHNPILV